MPHNGILCRTNENYFCTLYNAQDSLKRSVLNILWIETPRFRQREKKGKAADEKGSIFLNHRNILNRRNILNHRNLLLAPREITNITEKIITKYIEHYTKKYKQYPSTQWSERLEGPDAIQIAKYAREYRRMPTSIIPSPTFALITAFILFQMTGAIANASFRFARIPLDFSVNSKGN